MADKVVLDTSFCVPWLKEKGYEVVTVYVDTGATTAAEREAIRQRALSLGAVEHVTEDASQAVWDSVVVPLVKGGQLWGDVYPLLVSDRYVIVERALALCDQHQTRLFAHGCTGMGNDQFRFDQSVRSLGDYTILAPIREIQKEHTAVRAYEAQYLEARGFSVPQKSGKYSINANVLGTTSSGSEIDEWLAPDDETYTVCAHPTTLRARPGREPRRQEAARPRDPQGAERQARRVWRGPRHLHRRHHHRAQGAHRLRVPRSVRAHHRSPRARGERVVGAAKRLQADGRQEVGGARLQGLLRAAQGRPRGLSRREPDLRHR
jgi:hypothetical protein